MESQNKTDGLDELLEKLCEDRLNETEQQDLVRLLTQSEENRARYLDYVELHAALWAGSSNASGRPVDLSVSRQVASEEAGHLAKTAADSAITRPRPSLLMGAGALAISLLILVTFGIVHFTRNQASIPVTSEMTAPVGEEATDNGVAVLTRLADVRWALAAPPAVGDTLPPGRIAINAGLIELEFYSGAAVIIEGPAELELLSSDLCFCHAGKLRAYVPRPAQGFTVLSPEIKLVDRGTEFGMDVRAASETEVHVFEGKVELFPPGTEDSSPTGEELVAGHAVLVRRSGESLRLDSQLDHFVSTIELDRRIAEKVEKRRASLERCWQTLRSDRRTIVAYTFEPNGSFGRILPAIGTEASLLDGVIIGCQWVEGRLPGKNALEFKRPGDRVRIHVPGEFESLTLSAWIRVDGLDRPFQTLLLTDRYRPGEPHWQIKDNGRVLLGVRHTVNQGHNYASPVVFDLSRLGQWIHVACVFDGHAGEVRHYVDGRVIHVEPVVATVPLHIGDAEIGNWGAPARESPTPIRSFNGRIDEFAIFSAALSNTDIQDIYVQGKP